MSTLKWNRPKDQTFEAGLDRGVLYLESGKAIAWSGLINVEDGGSSDTKNLYRDGQMYLSVVGGRDWEGSLEAYTYPSEFDDLIGIVELGDGLYADSQIPKQFGLSYRTMVSSPNLNEPVQHYKIHLIYQAMASLEPITYSTLTSNGLDPSAFKFGLTAVPQKVPMGRPTAHFILDTRGMEEDTRATIEGILYGKFGAEPYMPGVPELIDILSYGDTVTVVENFYQAGEPLPAGKNVGDSKGTWTATGSSKNIFMIDNPFPQPDGSVDNTPDEYFQIDNVVADFISDPNHPENWEQVYEFNGAGSSLAFRLMSDTDGTPYYSYGEGPSNVGVDTDDTAYYSPGSNEATVNEDTDGTPYYDPN